MPRFLFGDELGNIKSLQCSSEPAGSSTGFKSQVDTLSKGSGTKRGVQGLAVAFREGDKLLAAAYSDGAITVSPLNGDDLCEAHHTWKEQFDASEKYIALTASNKGIYSCTSNGALRLTPISDHSARRTASLTTRLHDWRLSLSDNSFAYGGYEVDLSVWNTERAFSTDAPAPSGQKRSRKDTLFPAEIWRAKNVAHDSLGLRQPIRITSLTYLHTASPSPSHHHLLTGTQSGDIRRYDTRAARKPVADWKGLAKVGGVRRVEKGLGEHETFVSDNGGNFFALDLRTGKIAYSYKHIAGAVVSFALSPGLLASASIDRFTRIHSTPGLPAEPKKQQEKRGEILDKVFLSSIPTVIIAWDGAADSTRIAPEEEGEAEGGDGEEDDGDDVWENMKNVEDDSDAEGERRKRKKNS